MKSVCQECVNFLFVFLKIYFRKHFAKYLNKKAIVLLCVDFHIFDF